MFLQNQVTELVVKNSCSIRLGPRPRKDLCNSGFCGSIRSCDVQCV